MTNQKFYTITNNILIKEYTSEDICKLFNITESMLNEKLKTNDLDFIRLEQFFGDGYLEFVKVYLNKKECLKIVEKTLVSNFENLNSNLHRILVELDKIRKELNDG